MLYPKDYGPIYAETVLNRFPVEPWNTLSNLVFLFLIIYFTRATKLNFRSYPLIVVSLPILTIGFIGGTIYHATRSHRMWLIMDWAPIMILSILASIYFIKILTGKRALSFLVPLISFLAMRMLMATTALPMGFKISIAYSGLASLILVPAYLTAIKFKSNILYLNYCTLIFAIAVLFRYLDQFNLLPMGTHFMWHLCGGISVWYLMKYIMEIERLVHPKIRTN